MYILKTYLLAAPSLLLVLSEYGYLRTFTCKSCTVLITCPSQKHAQ